MKKSGLTSATLQDLRRRARETAGFEVEVEMEIEGEPQEFSDVGTPSPGDDIAPDLPGEPWNHDWEVTDPVVAEPEDNTERNTGHVDAQMVRNVIAGR